MTALNFQGPGGRGLKSVAETAEKLRHVHDPALDMNLYSICEGRRM